MRNKSMNLSHLTLGVCYYPEHWPKTLWQDDLERMREYGLEVVRVGEFAWSLFEPQEGAFDFSLFDEFLDLAAQTGMKVIFGTPTATPPAWLSQKYPEILNATMEGVPYQHGMRRHYNYNAPIYRELVGRIVTRLAQRYCPHPAVIGWQIDNELNCETAEFYSQADHTAFRAYLKEKFGTLDALNEAWGTRFWSQTYTDWEQVHLIRPTVKASPNPHLALEEKRFISHSAIGFCALQADILRQYTPPGQWITTNGLFPHIDNHEMTDRSLDFITYDSYPNFAYGMDHFDPTDGLLDRRWSMNLSRVRAVSPVFGIMEQQAGPGGWDTRLMQPMPKPGQMRLWTYQSIAHGADFVSFFRWRTCGYGTEIYWHGLNDYDNRENRRVRELMRIAHEVDRLADIAGSRYQANIALLRDYDNEWDGEQDLWHGPLEHAGHLSWFAAAQHSHTPMDFLYMRTQGTNPTEFADLTRYKLLVYAHPTIMTGQVAELLTEYVKQGGTLIIGARSGYKDEFGRCPMRPMPGLLSDLCGATVEDYTILGPNDSTQSVLWEDETLDAPIFNDVLSPLPNADIQGVYLHNFYHGWPALVMNKVGQGRVYYFGGGFTERTAHAFLRKLGVMSPYSGRITLPSTVELAVRVKGGVETLILLNYLPSDSTIMVHTPMRNLLTGEQLSGQARLEPYGVMVLRAE